MATVKGDHRAIMARGRRLPGTCQAREPRGSRDIVALSGGKAGSMPLMKDAAFTLGIHHTTLVKWVRQLGIEPAVDRMLDARCKSLTDEQIEQLRDLQRAKAALRHQPVAIVRVSARASAAQPASRSFDTSARNDPSENALRNARGHSGTGGSSDGLPDVRDAPIGWRAVPSFVRDEHEIPVTTFQRYVKMGVVSVTKEKHREKPRVLPDNWLTPEQQAQFHRAFRDGTLDGLHVLGDPCHVCGWSSAREPVPTVKRVHEG